ncbi:MULTISPECIES: 3-oxoacyl-ACP synthase III family protein [Streptomycetaceae]|uniref:3-oxoacyl-[acyl-carrier-protein] synthase n=1 Tax=Streptantibioticus cattleyicolor (strain ATCC 35852 / DSM 46488 / JCM 4925 / NBRC 14057 / NRRL 8057) TaxID=1003195 RepID=F8K435_STREN|nr:MULTISPECIES: 3-oxoacyl-ACP synthase III family protein [Streptomycetaceae]AEW92573.1 3-oxoacyl-[acyl-carrier-protein] synthase [Streptantibioticus cattleyicolor NRRL 8057 = DSM 46488]MYS57357.1 3-oxoacyl-ACP synthase [Streptomyces sp. SID5468]CCB72929.1 3-oxoacyl-[acyl-carrier-protein] synthase [Streptantibioticus cattleyicolor NRRL 8057 = DSM 46488]
MATEPDDHTGRHAQLIDVVSYLPERVVSNAGPRGAHDDLGDHEFFRGVAERRFASPDHSSAELGAAACAKLLRRTRLAADEVDLIIYNCVFNDTFWPGIGPAVQSAIGASHATVLQLDTSCCSWLTGLRTAKAFVESGVHRNIIVLTVTNFVSRLPEFQRSKRSRVLGDGATATLVAPGRPSILSAYERSHGENYGLLRFEPEPVDGVFRNYWERGCGPITVNFTKERLAAIRENSMALVPQAVAASLAEAGLTTDDVSLLITHQPNEDFLTEWRKRCGIDEARTHDTLAKYGNLFAGSIPVTVADALDRGLVEDGDVLAFGTFANGGDLVSAMTVRWRADR